MAFKMKGNPLKMGSMATKSAMKMKKESPMEMKKESPMKLSEEDKKKAMDNAMPEARVSSMSRQTMDSAKKRKLMTASGSFDMDKARTELRRLKSMSSPTAKNDAHQKELTRLIKAFS